MLKKLIKVVLLMIVVAVVVDSLPDIKRYIKIRAM